MGSSKSSAPVTYIPEPAAPTVFQSVIPKEHFQLAADYIAELKADREKRKAERYLEVGTPEEIGQRMKERDAKTEAAYLSSLPNSLSNDAVEKIMAQVVNRRADEAGLDRPDGTKAPPKPAPAPEPAPAPAPKPALYNKGKWGTTWGMGSYTTEELRKRFGLAYNPDLEKEASKKRVGGGTYNEAGDIWGKSSTGKDIYLGRATGLYGNKELIAGHAKQADSGETIHARDNTNLSSIGDRAGAIYNVWKRD